jgi:uncharacterized protein (TIGR02118 family)
LHHRGFSPIYRQTNKRTLLFGVSEEPNLQGAEPNERESLQHGSAPRFQLNAQEFKEEAVATSSGKPLKTVALLGRKPGMTFAQFDDYWRNVHAPLAAQVPGVTSYIQRHVVPEDGEPDNGFGIDGLVILNYESAEAMEAGWASPAGQVALADVPNFLGKHYVIVVEDHVVV